MKHWRAVVMLGVGLTAACSGGPVSEAPPDIQYGLDECSHCRMIISDERFAAALTRHGRAWRFDDLACLLAHWRERHPGEDAAAWVHDHGSRRWLRAETAWFVRRRDLATPMGSGLVAYSSRRQAESLGAEAEGVYEWEELLQTAGWRRREP